MVNTENRKRLADVPSDKVFWCQDGRVMKNLGELAAALRQMSSDTYLYHANAQKNDFSKWIKDVIGDETLAKDLQKVANNHAAAQKVEARVSWLKART